MLAGVPFASGDPVVRYADSGTGGLQDGYASGAPWVRLLAVHCV
jgi:hypothetical protein